MCFLPLALNDRDVSVVSVGLFMHYANDCPTGPFKEIDPTTAWYIQHRTPQLISKLHGREIERSCRAAAVDRKTQTSLAEEKANPVLLNRLALQV